MIVHTTTAQLQRLKLWRDLCPDYQSRPVTDLFNAYRIELSPAVESLFDKHYKLLFVINYHSGVPAKHSLLALHQYLITKALQQPDLWGEFRGLDYSLLVIDCTLLSTYGLITFQQMIGLAGTPFVASTLSYTPIHTLSGPQGSPLVMQQPQVLQALTIPENIDKPGQEIESKQTIQFLNHQLEMVSAENLQLKKDMESLQQTVAALQKKCTEVVDEQKEQNKKWAELLPNLETLKRKVQIKDEAPEVMVSATVKAMLKLCKVKRESSSDAVKGKSPNSKLQKMSSSDQDDKINRHGQEEKENRCSLPAPSSNPSIAYPFKGNGSSAMFPASGFLTLSPFPRAQMGMPSLLPSLSLTGEVEF